MDEKEIIKEAQNFLNGLTRDQLIKVLSSAGFEVEDGEGKVIFTNVDEEPKPKRKFKL